MKNFSDPAYQWEVGLWAPKTSDHIRCVFRIEKKPNARACRKKRDGVQKGFPESRELGRIVRLGVGAEREGGRTVQHHRPGRAGVLSRAFEDHEPPTGQLDFRRFSSRAVSVDAKRPRGA